MTDRVCRDPRFTILQVDDWIVVDREIEDRSEGPWDDDFVVAHFDTLEEAKLAYPDAAIGDALT